MTHWILVADSSGARIFAIAGRKEKLHLVREEHNPAGRLRTSELVSDESGRLNKSGASGTRSAMDPRTTAHEEVAEEFARSLARLLSHEGEHGAYATLSLVAPPHFLGLLRPMLTKEVDQRVRSTLARDLVHVSSADLPPHLEPLLVPGLFM